MGALAVACKQWNNAISEPFGQSVVFRSDRRLPFHNQNLVGCDIPLAARAI
jgi:hypothetical protein